MLPECDRASYERGKDGVMNICIFLIVVGVGLATAQTQGRCGEEIVTSRILGGQNILRCTWPYTTLVSIKLYYNNNIGSADFGNLTICGGSVINDQYILTSAVCAAPLYGPAGASVRQSTRVVVGDFDERQTDFSSDGYPEQIIPVADVRIHKLYDNITTSHNIAILKLAQPIRYDNCKQPACLLPQQTASESRCGGSPDVDETCIMASVGLRFQDAASTSNIPQQAPVKMFSRVLTETILKASPGNVLPDGAVIGQTFDPSVQACLFDWGGIVVCRNSGRYWLRGLIGTNNCVLSNNPSSRAPPIFITEVSQYRMWIDSCVANFNFCDTLPYF